MPASSGYPYAGDTPSWVPKEKRATATQAQLPERISSEPDYRWTTSLQPHFELIQVRDEATRNLQTVLFATASDTQMRLRAFQQLNRNAAHGDDDAFAVLKQWQESGLNLE